MTDKIFFAAGNYFKGELREHRALPDHWVITGARWVKSKKRFSGQRNINSVGTGKPVEIQESDLPE